MNWEIECKRWHDQALESLTKFGRCPFMLRVYPLPTDNCAVWLEPNGLDDAGRERLRCLNIGFKVLQPTAVLVCTDAWQARMDVFTEEFGLSQDLPMEQFQEQLARIVTENFGGSLSNAPARFRGEAAMTCIKGPKLPQSVSLFTFYHRAVIGGTRTGGSRRVVFERTTTPDAYTGVLNLIPDWWEVTV